VRRMHDAVGYLQKNRTNTVRLEFVQSMREVLVAIIKAHETECILAL
jgi:hypothetical protein